MIVVGIAYDISSAKIDFMNLDIQARERQGSEQQIDVRQCVIQDVEKSTLFGINL